MKGAITFEFECEDSDQAMAYWRAIIEVVRPVMLAPEHSGINIKDTVITLTEVTP